MLDVLLTIMLLAVAAVVVVFCFAVSVVVLRAAFKPKVEKTDRITVDVIEEERRRHDPHTDIFDV